MADTQLKKKIYGVLKVGYFSDPDDAVDVSDSPAIPADGPIASDVSCKTCVWSRSVIHFALVQVFLPSQRVTRLMEKNMGSGSGRTYPSARASRPGLAREVHRKAGIKRY